jgi:hypothetical protein
VALKIFGLLNIIDRKAAESFFGLSGTGGSYTGFPEVGWRGGQW